MTSPLKVVFLLLLLFQNQLNTLSQDFAAHIILNRPWTGIYPPSGAILVVAFGLKVIFGRVS